MRVQQFIDTRVYTKPKSKIKPGIVLSVLFVSICIGNCSTDATDATDPEDITPGDSSIVLDGSSTIEAHASTPQSNNSSTEINPSVESNVSVSAVISSEALNLRSSTESPSSEDAIESSLIKINDSSSEVLVMSSCSDGKMLESSSDEIPVGYSFARIEAESGTVSVGHVDFEGEGGTGTYIRLFSEGDVILYRDVDFGTGAKSIILTLAQKFSDATIELHIDSVDGDILSDVTVINTESWINWENQIITIPEVSGVHDLYFSAHHGHGAGDIDYFTLSPDSVPKIEEIVHPPIGGHAHNDYYHDRPLYDALDYGFLSVEADVFLKDGLLLVGHGTSELTDDRNLHDLYLAPLSARVQDSGGVVYSNVKTFYLMIDLKTNGEDAYAVLKPLLEPYHTMLTEFTNTTTTYNAVTIILTGSRPISDMETEAVRWAGYEGRIEDLYMNPNPHLMPWVGDNWDSHFDWNGSGEMTESERVLLSSLTQKADDNGQALRFWAVPDNVASWTAQVNAGVDYINSDLLPELAAF
ncbi:MAG: carbohydrate-binding protein, partial [Colwellia sp.]